MNRVEEFGKLPEWLQDLWQINSTLARKAEQYVLTKNKKLNVQLRCWYCHKLVTNPLPEGTVFRATAVCPECVENLEGWSIVEDHLPEEGKYVLGRHNRGTWCDSNDQDNVNCVVVKLVKGLSQVNRKLMENGILPNPIASPSGAVRSDVYRSEDECGNNEKPYYWAQFGSDSFFGQTITHWLSIPLL